MKSPFFLFFVSLFFSCSPDLKKIEQQLKEDKSRPGKVGSLRALEIIQRATLASLRPCAPPLSENFEGELISKLDVQLLKKDGKLWRKFFEKRHLFVTKNKAKLALNKNSLDDLNIQHRLERTLTFDGNITTLHASIGHGTATGSRPPRENERQNIIDAGLNSFLTFRGLKFEKCKNKSSNKILKNYKNISMNVYESNREQTKIVWNATTGIYDLRVKYSHLRIPKAVIIPLIRDVKKRGPVTSGFEDAIFFKDILLKKNLIQDVEKENETPNKN